MKDVSSKIETVKCVEANETDLSEIFEFSSQDLVSKEKASSK